MSPRSDSVCEVAHVALGCGREMCIGVAGIAAIMVRSCTTDCTTSTCTMGSGRCVRAHNPHSTFMLTPNTVTLYRHDMGLAYQRRFPCPRTSPQNLDPVQNVAHCAIVDLHRLISF